MSFSNELLKGRYKKNPKKKKQEEDIAPVRKDIETYVPSRSRVDDENAFRMELFNTNPLLFEDGYDIGDISGTILMTAGDSALNFAKGVGRFAEGIGDAVNYGVADIVDKIGDKDLAKALKKETQKSLVDDLTGSATNAFNRYSVAGRTTDAILEGMGQASAIMATGGLGNTLGWSAKGVSALTTGATAVSGYGSGVSEAYQGGATDEEAVIYGVISGGAEALTEALFGGMGKGVNALGFSHGLSSADDMLAKKIADKFSSQIVKNFVEFGVKASAEGVEEVLSGIAQAAGKKFTYMSEEDFSKILKDENLLEQFVVGTVTSGFMQSGVIPGTSKGSLKESVKNGTDFISGLNSNEQAVVDKVYKDEIAKAEKEAEKDGKKLKGKEKSKIYDDVLRRLEEGDIDIDTIESVLGGETYTKYKETADREDALFKEFEDLGNKIDATLKEQTRYKELSDMVEKLKTNSQRSQLKSQLGEEVFGIAKGSKLMESYSEKANRSKHFEADLSQYDEKQRETIQKAIDSGILNNTRKSHRFVDLIAKISADKGVAFDFTNNERLKNSSFAVEGKTVNGYKTDDGNVVINIDSAKSLNSVVGHEITHVLEGTELYATLQEVVKQYATTKGEYGDRMIQLRKLYEKTYSGKDFDDKLRQELTADIVGDYLFTDSEFINRLSTEQPNLFKKIFNEIKYLCKVATAGSKEARELERVKKTFEDVWKQSGKVQKNTAGSETPLYSLNDNLENVGKILYDNNNPLAIVNRATSSNHSSINWVYKSEIFSVTENKLFHEKISEINQGSQAFEKNSRDEYMIPIENKIVFTDGNYESPYVREIIEVLTEYQTEFEDIRERIYDVEKGKSSKQDAAQFCEQMYGKGNIVTYTSGNNKVYDWQNGKPKGKTRRTVVRNYFNKQYRAGNDKQGKEAQINDIAPVKETSSRDGVFFDGEKAKYSLSAETDNSMKNQSHKEKQLAIINEYHPKADWDYQTWITSVDDIKTYEETVDSIDYATTPDFTDEDVARALKTGKVMVYSSHDIRKGTFVTPSYMEAKNYAGQGKVNYKMVNLTDVAWIDSLQGQYAPVEIDSDVSYSLSLEDIKTKYADKTNYLFLFEHNDTISINNMVVKKEYRNQGIGTQILNDVIAYADEKGKTITLTPTTEYGTQNKLKKWYKANGFVENKGRNADLRLSDTMYRLPKTETKYSLNDIEGKPIDTARISSDETNTEYSLSHNPEIAKGQSDYIAKHKSSISVEELEEAQKVTAAMVDVMMKYSSILPEDKIGKVLTKNGSYDRSVENTTICVRTLAYNEFVDKVQEEIGRPLTQMESFLVSQKLYDIATEPQCLYCYVSLDRKAFNDMLLRYMQDRDTVIAKYNNSDKSPEAIEKLYEEFLNGRKDTKPMKARFNSWLNYVDNGTQLLSLADIATEARQSEIANSQDSVLKEQLKDARAYAQGASWSKIQKNYVAYRDEILKLGDRVVKNLNEHYGLRWYSFSDYSAAFIVENMQQITDASIRGLKGLSYTKDTDFAEIFAPSGMNINISVFVNKDANGNFYIDERQSAKFEEALRLREKYPNVGIVATVTDDDALRWAGEQEWSDVIIPFHIVRTGTDVAEYYKWLNYTSESADTIGDKDMWNAYLDSLNLKSENARKRVSKNIYPNEHKNDKATYLALCESRGLSPRFVRFAGEDWYMKLVNETRLSADNSSPLKPSFNLDAAQTSFQKFVEKGGYEGGWYKDGVDVDTEVKTVADDVLMGKKANEVDYGRQDGFVPENLIAGRKTNRNHGKPSLSEQGSQPTTYGNYNVTGEDVRFTEETAPVREDVAPKATTSAFPDDILPLREDEANAMVEEQNNIVEDTKEDVAPTQDIDSIGETPIITTKQKLSAQINHSQAELDKNIHLREKSNAYYDEKIAKAKAEYDAKKNKNTKEADRLLRSIERFKRLKGSADADFQKRINDVESRIAKLEDQSLRNHDKADRLEKYKKRADRQLEAEKNFLYEEFQQRKVELQEKLVDKNTYVSNKAMELYKELSGLKKGVRASQELGYLLDFGYKWSDLKSTLLKVNKWSDTVLNPDSEIESVVREAIGRDYDDKVYELDDIDNEYNRQVEEIEAEAQKKLDAFKVANQRMTKQQEYTDQMAELVGDTSSWKDKKLGISYKVNTLRRNLRDIVRDATGKRDIAKADAIYDELQGKYNHNEAELNREANRIKKAYADMKITNAESTYIQMLGELRHNPDTTLTEDVVKDYYEKHKDKIDTAKVDKAIEMARTTFDELLVRVNQVLTEQGMKEIPYRKGYFPHFTEEKQGFLAKLFNWKTQNNDIPTDIAGLTENFNPNRSWQSFNKQRKGDTTDYNFLKGLDTYVQGSLDWIYHIEDIQKRRAFENHIRYVHSEQGIKGRIDAIYNNEEYDAEEMQEQIDIVLKEAGNPLNNFVTDFRTATNTLAGKKSSVDRSVEEMTNRKFYSTMTNISNRVTGNMVAGSISSALTNLIPITQSWGQVSPISSLRAMSDTIRANFSDDGIVNKSDFLTNRLRRADNLYQTTWDKIGDKASILMDVIDGFTSQTVWRSKYLENISNGMSENEAIKDADQFAENVIAGRSRGNQPTVFDAKNPLVKALTAFQLEVNNQYGYMFKDMPQDMQNESKAKLVKGYATMFIGAYVYNALYSSLTGRNAAFDPIRIIQDLLRDIFGGDDDEEEEIAPSKVIMNFADDIIEELPFVGSMVGGGRMPISSALPYGEGVYEMFKGTLEDIESGDYKTLTNEWLNPLFYLAAPLGGGQLRKSYQGMKMFDKDNAVAGVTGSYTDSGNLRFPVEDTLGNRAKAFVFGQYANKNARKYFDEGYAPLKEKQIKEYAEVELPIADYWKYREGVKDLEKQSDKAAYINGLDITEKQKNILKSYLYDEEGYKEENPEKYAFLESEGIGFLGYKELDAETQDSWSWAFKHQDEYRHLKENGVYPEDYSVYRVPMLDFDEEGDKAYEWAFDNPEKATFGKVFGSGVKEYRQYTSDLYNIRADKDSNGKSISGSAKRKKKEYIFGLDIDDGAKYILFKSEYKADDTYNHEIINYLDSRDDISWDEMATILEELDFKVDRESRRISW